MYTKSERTIKKYTVHQAFESARRRLQKVGLDQVCTDCIHEGRHSYDDPITLEQLNQLSDKMYDDTLYYDGWKL